MNPLYISRESGAGLLGVITDGNDDINSNIKVIIYRFRFMVGNINSQLIHNRYRSRMEMGGMTAGAVYFEFVPGPMPQQAFGHLRSTGIAGADENNFHFIHI
jgi:hypothetical protein